MGFEQHIWDIDLLKNNSKLVEARKFVLVVESMFSVASGFMKISILLFYRRLSSRAVSNTFRAITWLSIGSIAICSSVLTLVPIFGCRPMSAFWDQVDMIKLLQGYEYRCFDEGADVLAASIISVVQDFITAILPTFLFWNLHIPMRQKVALFSIFAIGYGAVAIGAVRVYFSWLTFYASNDVTWSSWSLMLTAMLELHMGAFCANAPALKVFFKHFFHDKLSVRSRTKTPVTSDFSDNPKASMMTSTSTSFVMRMFASLLSKSSHLGSSSGYLSESHNTVSAGANGDIQVVREVNITLSTLPTAHKQDLRRHESSTTTDIIFDHYYDDIELGRYNTGQNSRASSLQIPEPMDDRSMTKLSPLPRSPMSPMSIRSLFTDAADPPSHTSKGLPFIPSQTRSDDRRRYGGFL